MYNNLETVNFNISRGLEYRNIIPKDYVQIIQKRNRLSFIPGTISIYTAGDEVNLGPGKYLLTTIKINQEIEISKMININPESNQSASQNLLVIVRFNYTDASSIACKVHKNLSYNDPGFCHEINNAINRIVSQSNKAMTLVSDKNIEKLEELIHHSVRLVVDKYSLANLSVKFEKFE